MATTGPNDQSEHVLSAVLVDFYGTIAHEDDVVRQRICEKVAAASSSPTSPAEVARRWWVAFVDQCASSHGGAFKSQRAALKDALARVLAGLDSRVDADQLIADQFDFWRHPPLFDDVRPFLASLQVPVCVVSNIDRADLEAALEHHELTVDHVVTSEDAKSYKPRPEPFRRALEALDVDPPGVVHVGDSLSSDVAGASDLGIRVAWVNRTARQRPPGISLWAEVADLLELVALVDRAQDQR